MDKYNNKVKEQLSVLKRHIHLQARDIKWLMFFSVVGYMIYSAIGNDFLTNPDSSVFLVYKYAQEEKANGRVGLQFVDNIFGRIVSAPFAVIGTVILYAIIIVLIVHILEVKDSILMVFLSGLFIILSPVTSSTISYHCFSIAFTIGYLLAVLSVSILKIINNRVYRICIASMLLMVSLTLYQAYLPVAIVLILLVVLLKLIHDEELCTIVRFGIDGGISLLGGVVLYILCLKVSRTQLTSARSFDKMGRLEISKIPHLIMRSYHNFFQFFFGDELLNNHFMNRYVWNAIVAISVLALLIYICVKKNLHKTIGCLIVYWLTVFVLPIAFEFISIMAPDVDSTGTTGIIIVPTMPLFYCMFLMLLYKAYKINKAWIFRGLSLICCPILIVHVSFTALFINQMWLNLNQMRTLCGSMIEDVWDEYGYNKSDILLITGSKDDGNFANDWHGMKSYLKGTLACHGYSWKGWLQNWCYTSFMDYYLGVKYDYADLESYESIINTQRWKDMPIYPCIGSIERIDGFIVIKLSD